MVFHEHLEHFGPITFMLYCQERGQGASESLHNDEKRISSKTHNRFTGHVKQEVAEVKMRLLGSKRRLAGSGRRQTP